MEREVIKSVAKKYFCNLGMLYQDQIDPELIHSFQKQGPLKPTLLLQQNEFTGTFLKCEAMLFAGDSNYSLKFLKEKMTDFCLDLKLVPARTLEYEYDTENIVSMQIKTNDFPVFLGLHSRKKNFGCTSLKYPLIFVLVEGVPIVTGITFFFRSAT